MGRQGVQLPRLGIGLPRLAESDVQTGRVDIRHLCHDVHCQHPAPGVDHGVFKPGGGRLLCLRRLKLPKSLVRGLQLGFQVRGALPAVRQIRPQAVHLAPQHSDGHGLNRQDQNRQFPMLLPHESPLPIRCAFPTPPLSGG